ncbi:hypothetical protein IL252_04875 [Halomicrobium sp. IBSBa]|uniref:DUF7263 family protein n=1 Tax=Halomicrobium sp. IBSBa TaxID=2778916 RepID=UPI001ABF1853|nr:hypothetical protein [Halomicrobium sp. IBSBa]MBO4247152.1 hypothetical protein [Halomicrobium sp. IBSBa]
MNGRTREASERAQTALPALAIALLVLTMVTGIGLALADGAIGAADREPGERRVAVSLAAGLVAPESPLTERANVLDEERLSNVDQRQLRTAFPVTDETAVRVELDGDSLVTTGTPRTGTTIRRLVVVEERTTERIEPSLGWQRRVTLPQRGASARLTLVPPAGTSVTTVRANDRVVLHDEDGLAGTYEIDLSRFETTTLQFSASGPLPDGSVEVEYDALRTRKATLAVTADG